MAHGAVSTSGDAICGWLTLKKTMASTQDVKENGQVDVQQYAEPVEILNAGGGTGPDARDVSDSATPSIGDGLAGQKASETVVLYEYEVTHQVIKCRVGEGTDSEVAGNLVRGETAIVDKVQRMENGH